MGCIVENKKSLSLVILPLPKKKMLVATLNYCGVMSSPFEFYCSDYENQLATISNIFMQLLPKFLPNFKKEAFNWKFGKIQHNCKKGRYSPMFQVQAGIENNRFLNVEQFNKKWQQAFDSYQVNNNLCFKYTQQEMNNTRFYDLLVFYALIKYVYNIDDFTNLDKLDVQKYRQVLQPFYNLSFLDEERKLKIVMKNLQCLNADVFFFQEITDKFIEQVRNQNKYFIQTDPTKDTMIIARKGPFKQQKDTELVLRGLTQNQLSNINCANRTSIMCLDNFILVSLHLSSKADKNKLEVQNLKKGLFDLKLDMQDYDIIAGGDINSFVTMDSNFNSKFNMYPTEETALTTIKKRTMTQGQFNKGQKLVKQSKDKILSTLEIESSYIAFINGKNPLPTSFIPTNEHPFDHFVVVANLQSNLS